MLEQSVTPCMFSSTQGDWEAGIPGEVLKQVSVAGQGGAVQQGAEVVQDCWPAHTMSWPSVDEFCEVRSRGPYYFDGKYGSYAW